MLTIEGQPRPESSNGPGLPKARIPSKGTQCVETDSSFLTRDSVIYCGPGNYLELSNSLIAENKGYHGGAVYADSGFFYILIIAFQGNNVSYFGGVAVMFKRQW